jgi:hypothetical protein
MIVDGHLQAGDGQEYPCRSIVWSGPAIVDACSVQAGYGHLLVLTKNGALYGANLDTGAKVKLCDVELPDTPQNDDAGYFGAPTLRLHASLDGTYAAIVVDKGRKGMVVEVGSGKVTMRLDGSDYYEETVPFSACFLCFEGINVFIHRTAWNRLDAADPATGASLTDRTIEPYAKSNKAPEHYLDYFHGQLLASPNGSRIFDDGWVWHPASIPRTWSVTEWLRSNPWESEDGSSVVDYDIRDDWTTPACWLDDKTIALWSWEDESEDDASQAGKYAGIQFLDVIAGTQSPRERWMMDVDKKCGLALFSDGRRLYATTEEGTTIWDLASRAPICSLPDFVARLLDVRRGALITFGPATIVEVPLPWTSSA